MKRKYEELIRAIELDWEMFTEEEGMPVEQATDRMLLNWGVELQYQQEEREILLGMLFQYVKNASETEKEELLKELTMLLENPHMEIVQGG